MRAGHDDRVLAVDHAVRHVAGVDPDVELRRDELVLGVIGLFEFHGLGVLRFGRGGDGLPLVGHRAERATGSQYRRCQCLDVHFLFFLFVLGALRAGEFC